MIKLIKNIKDVGVFNNYESKLTGITQEFSHMNFIYGYNTYGKSTLCDILKSASDNSCERIEQRKSIPDGNHPVVVINTDEGRACFDSDKWNPNALINKIMVFDDEFVAKNVFSGLDLIGDRDTKENFTEFILGDEGVRIAQEIEELKMKQKELKNDMEKSIPPSQEGKSDKEIKQYVSMKVDEPLEELIKKQKAIKKRIDEKQTRLANLEKMNRFQDFNFSSRRKLEKLFTDIKQFCDVLEMAFKIPPSAVITYQEYINDKFAKDNNAEQWLSQGVQYLGDDEVCPFCGQKIVQNGIIEIIKNVLGNDYQKHKKTIMFQLDGIHIHWDILELSKNILESKSKLDDAKKIFGTELDDFDDVLKLLLKRAKAEEDKLQNDIYNLQELQKRNIEIKKAFPGNSVEFGMKIDRIFAEYQSIWDDFNNCIVEMNALLKDIRSQTQKETLSIADDSKKELAALKEKIDRLNEDEKCIGWNTFYENKRIVEKETRDKSKELEENQKNYLNKYFSSINQIFKKYGAKNFKIERGALSRKGNKNVIGINVLFNGVTIDDKKNLKRIFSASDQRALGMAVFMAKIENMPAEERTNLILVLDDPITSFDENRMRNFTQHIRELSSQLNQIIILSHHFAFARHIKDSYKEEKFNFYQLENISDGRGNGIFDMNADECLISGIEKLFNEIMKFNEGNLDKITGNDLRIFMEVYLKCVFSKQYKEAGLDKMKLGERIDKLFEMNVISEKVKDKLHGYRNEFNPDSHMPTNSNIEDTRNISTDMIDYIFSNVRIGEFC